jgi:hypothetical protein
MMESEVAFIAIGFEITAKCLNQEMLIMGSDYLVLSTYPKIPLLKRLSKMKEVIYTFGLCLKIIGLSFLRTGYG